MPEGESIQVFVLVKAVPVMTQELEEAMCVAGVRLDGPRTEWVRLHPVPFRDLDDDSKFAKYEGIKGCHRTDRRPETGHPYTERSSAASGSAARVAGLHGVPTSALGQRSICEMVALNRGGSGP